MRSIRLLTAVALFLPTLAQAQFYYMPASSVGVSRASFVEMVMGRVGNSMGGTYCFKDVKQQSYASAVCGAKGLGIVTGDASTKFRPDDAITFVEAAAVALRASGHYVQSDSLWYRPYLSVLSDLDAFPSSISNIFYPISSSQAQELIGNVFDADHTSNSNTSNTSSNSTTTSSDTDSNDSVRVTVKASDTRADIGDTVTYTITVKNDDNDDIENLDVRAYIDRDFDFVSASDSGDYRSDRIEWDNVDIDEDESETFTVKLRVAGGANDGDKLSFRVKADDSEVRKTLTVDEDANSNNSNNNDLRISITDSPATAEPGDTVTYTIRLENNDNSDMRVDVRALLDSDMEFVSASDDGDESNDRVDWDNVLVREDDEETVTLKVRIDSSVNDGDTVRLEVRADDEEDTETTSIEDNGSSNNSTNEDISISITDTPDPVGIGEIVTYTIRLENDSNDDQEVDVVAYLDEGMNIYTSSDLSERIAKEVRWRDLFIPENGYRTVNIKVRVNSRVSDGDTIQLRVDVDDASEEESTKIRN